MVFLVPQNMEAIPVPRVLVQGNLLESLSQERFER